MFGKLNLKSIDIKDEYRSSEDVIEFPEAAKQSLLNFCPDKQPEYELFFTNEDSSKPKLLSEKKRQKYQVNDNTLSSKKDR